MSGIIFDLDGTVIDSAPDIHACMARVLAAHDLRALSFEQVRSFIGNGVGALVSRCIAAAGQRDMPDLHAQMMREFQSFYETDIRLTSLYPNAESTLRALHRDGFRLGLCTNKPEAATQAVLEHFGIHALFDAIVCGDSRFARKPDPAPLRHLTDTLPARHFLFVGDSEVDARTAQAAGLPFAIFTRGYPTTPVEALYHDAQFDDFAQLRPIVDRIAPLPQ